MSQRFRGGWLLRALGAGGLLLASLSVWAYTETSGGYNLPTGATETAASVYRLHMIIFGVCCVIGFVVFGAMIYSIIKHRRSVHPKPADFHESTTVEIIWTIIPFIILIGMAIPAAGTLIKMEDTRGAAMTIKVTGYQWKWHYEYLGENVSFFSTLSPQSNQARQRGSGIDPMTVPNYLVDVDNELVLPVGKKIRFLVTSNDVIHAWWVAEFAIKKDAIPGYINELWTVIEHPGTYRGVCAELCGRDHGYMPIVVRAVPEAEYQAWLAQRKGSVDPKMLTVANAAPTTATDGLATAAGPTSPAATAGETAPAPDAAAAPGTVAAAPAAAPAPAAAAPLTKDVLMAQGKKVYETNCQACHQANGKGLPPNFPALEASKLANGAALDHIMQTLNGKGLMTPFRHLSDADLAAVITYERNSWGNKGSVVQPADVAAAR